VAELARLTIRRFAPLLFVGIALMLAAAPMLLQLYGPGYAESGTAVLRLLACASAFRAVTALHIGVCRVVGRGSRILAVQGGTFALVMALTVALAPGYGIEGVAAAWLVANGIVAVASAPLLIHILRRGGTPTPQRTEGVMSCATSA
jgi:O-antigen/teichoic acid export membrane protein